MTTNGPNNSRDNFPTAAGIVLGLGIGGFFDGILLHQVLQWHHMVSQVYTPTTVQNLQQNVLADGFFHSATYIFVVAGLTLLWRKAHRTHIQWSGKMLAGSLLLGFGIFNVVEGILDHHLLGIHHVNETVPSDQWIYWDLGFLVWGAVMIVGGWALLKAGRRATIRERREPGRP
jgi:uncharacterized membrane protein